VIAEYRHSVERSSDVARSRIVFEPSHQPMTSGAPLSPNVPDSPRLTWCVVHDVRSLTPVSQNNADADLAARHNGNAACRACLYLCIVDAERAAHRLRRK
jgi:hypothetical protein